MLFWDPKLYYMGKEYFPLNTFEQCSPENRRQKKSENGSRAKQISFYNTA